MIIQNNLYNLLNYINWIIDHLIEKYINTDDSISLAKYNAYESYKYYINHGENEYIAMKEACRQMSYDYSIITNSSMNVSLVKKCNNINDMINFIKKFN